MKKPRDIAVLIEVAERRRDEAVQALAAVRRERQTADAQMVQLQAYTQDAEQRWRARASVGVTPTLLATHRQFMAKLEDAVAFQNQVLQQMADRIGRHEAALVEAERALATLRRVQERWQRDWQGHLQRLEQKANDEMAATQHRRRLHPHT